MSISLDNNAHAEIVCLLSNRKPDTKVRIDVDLEDYYRIRGGGAYDLDPLIVER